MCVTKVTYSTRLPGWLVDSNQQPLGPKSNTLSTKLSQLANK